MPENDRDRLTERQKREVEYHRDRAKDHEIRLSKPFSWDVIDHPSRRWWNAYWRMYSYLIKLDLRGKKVLIVGCGFGDDALRVAKLGAEVYAIDISPESLLIARKMSRREGLDIVFEEMPAETLKYKSDYFDCVIARDILHHVNIPLVMGEIRRVSKVGAILLINEIYTHSFADRIRHSRPVEQWLYPAMQRFIYGPGKPYITEDERKLTEKDLFEIKRLVKVCDLVDYFNLFVTRIVPDRFEILSKIDRLLLISLKLFGRFLAGRILLAGHISK